MTKPRPPIDTPGKARAAREYLKLSKGELGSLLRLGNARDTVRRIEEGTGKRGVPGPYQIALEALCGGFRPAGVGIKKGDK